MAALAAVLAPVASHAGVFGTLGNFDVVNDTGQPTYGFEIDIEDPHYKSPVDPSYNTNYRITSVFGLDRNFGIPGGPAAVVRYGSPTVTYDIPGGGVRIRYGGNGGSISTPNGTFPSPGDSCWPGSGIWSTASACDHFGVATTNSPTKVSYYWFMDKGGSVTQAAGVPPVIILPPAPPPPGVPPPPPLPPLMKVPGPDLGGPHVDNPAFWVKIIQTTLNDNVALIDLLGGDHPGAVPEIANLDHETQIEWQPLQVGKVDEVSKALDAPTPSTVYKFQFFEYQGSYDTEGLVDPATSETPQVDVNGTFVTLAADGAKHYLTFVGQQIAGFNVNEVGPVPEPETWALMLGGLGAIGFLARLRRAT